MSDDLVFTHWLEVGIVGMIELVRYLRFWEGSDMPSVAMQQHDCIFMVDINLRSGVASIWASTSKECTCEHALTLGTHMDTILKNVQRVDGRLQPTVADVWDLYEAWYLFYPIREHLRSWNEMQWEAGIIDGSIQP